MSAQVKNTLIAMLVLLTGLLISTSSNAWPGSFIGIGIGGYGGGGVIVANPGPYYNPRGYYYGGGWVGPNVVINVPTRRYYVPVCENLEVCDEYGDCWIERYCD